MADREDIIELLNLYGLAMDTRRWDLVDRIFTADVDADYCASSHLTERARFKAKPALGALPAGQTFHKPLQFPRASHLPLPDLVQAGVPAALNCDPHPLILRHFAL